jgi:hypothetical protein
MREHVPAFHKIMCDRCDASREGFAPTLFPPGWGTVSVVQMLDGTLTRVVHAELCRACVDAAAKRMAQFTIGEDAP